MACADSIDSSTKKANNSLLNYLHYMEDKSSHNVVDKVQDYQSRDCRFDLLLLSFSSPISNYDLCGALNLSSFTHKL